MARKVAGACWTAVLAACGSVTAQTPSVRIEGPDLLAEASRTAGTYTLQQRTGGAQFTAGVAAKVNGRWLHSSDYPTHTVSSGSGPDANQVPELTIVSGGLPGEPELVCSLWLHGKPAYAEVEVAVRNTTQQQIEVQAIRAIEIRDSQMLDLGGPESADRLLSDSFSEDRPAMSIHDLGDDSKGLYRGVGSQLIYNRRSGNSLFVGALSSERWLTVLRVHAEKNSAKIVGYEAEATGTTELAAENSLRTSPPQDQVELSLSLAPGKEMASEKLMIGLGSDYHAQLEAYGSLIRDLHHARVGIPTPIGWWSWTAYYFGLNQGAALTNAQFLAEHLKHLGYRFFHIDEGYQYARGEYTTENAAKFPAGMNALEAGVQALGLIPGIWTAPFEVSERSWVYQNHQDWLVQNSERQPIHAGFVIARRANKPLDALYVLDTTNPDAQDYLRQTYKTLTRDWGIRYIKLDFMEDSAIEGHYFRPHTTALEAQRIGLQIIREAVGNDVILDKDGSPMLNPVGIVDCGRTSQDTGHTFEASRDAATGIAARYYMHRNFFVSDPDAFTVSRQNVTEQEWHGGKRALTLDEARVSIALAAISGGMFEIGDDLPTLFLDPDRMALVQNQVLIDIARYGHASIPVDLMTYTPEEELPSIFMLHESKRQAILTVFNWTEKERQQNLQFSDLGLPLNGHHQFSDVLADRTPIRQSPESVAITLAPRSVRMLKIIELSIPAAAPSVIAQVPEHAAAGQPVRFSAAVGPDGPPALADHWNFGDGTSTYGEAVEHTFTHPGTFTVRLTAEGLDGIPFDKTYQISVTGSLDTRFNPEHAIRRERK